MHYTPLQATTGNEEITQRLIPFSSVSSNVSADVENKLLRPIVTTDLTASEAINNKRSSAEHDGREAIPSPGHLVRRDAGRTVSQRGRGLPDDSLE